MTSESQIKNLKSSENEIWKPIKGYEGMYEISSIGKVKSISRISTNFGYPMMLPERIVKQFLLKAGYSRLGLHLNGQCKMFLVHRLVAIHFIDNPDNLPEVNHLDLNKANNSCNNLQWATARENQKHARENGAYRMIKRGEDNHNAKITKQDVLNIRESLRTKEIRVRDLAKKYNITRGTIDKIRVRLIWNHV